MLSQLKYYYSYHLHLLIWRKKIINLKEVLFIDLNWLGFLNHQQYQYEHPNLPPSLIQSNKAPYTSFHNHGSQKWVPPNSSLPFKYGHFPLNHEYGRKSNSLIGFPKYPYKLPLKDSPALPHSTPRSPKGWVQSSIDRQWPHPRYGCFLKWWVPPISTRSADHF